MLCYRNDNAAIAIKLNGNQILLKNEVLGFSIAVTDCLVQFYSLCRKVILYLELFYEL